MTVATGSSLLNSDLQNEITSLKKALERERAAHRAEFVLNLGQSKLLEMIAHGEPLKETLTNLMLLIESQSSGLTCSVVLLDKTGLLIRPGAAPNLPKEYTDALDGLPIGPNTGSCGSAMYLRKQVIVSNMLEDPLWASYKHLIEPYGFLACWSTPIFANKHDLVGAFAMYYREQRNPGEHDLELINFATHIAGIAIEHSRRESELARYRENLEDLIKQRTAELTLANHDSEAANLSLSKANQELANALSTLRFTQEELIQKEKLASLGALVSGIAHELNTPISNCLMTITSLSDKSHRLAEVYQQGIKRSDLETYIKDAVSSTDILLRNLNRTKELVTSFKQIEMDQTSLERRRFSLEEYIPEVLTAIKPSFQQESITINQNIQHGLVMDSYPGALSQVINKLISNAMLHGFEDRDSGVISILAHAIDDHWLELVISDDGNGISPENQHHIFHPFFTTTRNWGSTGLGLHIVHNIVTGLMGGRIRFQSELDIGTSFYLTLPFTAPQLECQRDLS